MEDKIITLFYFTMLKVIYPIVIILISLINITVNAQNDYPVKVAKLHEEGSPGLEAIRKDFKAKNPGHDLFYFPATKQVPSHDHTQVLFVQQGGGTATITDNQGAKKSSKVSIGDILWLQEGETMEADSLLGLLAFILPDKPENVIPSFIRPDWDEKNTDTPGGCATETNAYRRILLTWSENVGNYIYHSINAHRVRIRDSFSHYHPIDKGFDEFYLVQMVLPGAKLFTSDKIDQISDPDAINKEQIDDLIKEHSLNVGDLIYLPRGVMHRGFGGVLAQVIAVPGFIPGSEIGVDHFLKRINEKLGLNGSTSLPFNKQASAYQVIR
ncbi:MAG: hypothetical protein WD431_06110 [Cyclobacteriaceae bacterium]